MIVFYIDYVYRTTTDIGPFWNMTLQCVITGHTDHHNMSVYRVIPLYKLFQKLKLT